MQGMLECIPFWLMKPKVAVRKSSFLWLSDTSDVDAATIFEHFLLYTQATSLNAESQSSYIIETCACRRAYHKVMMQQQDFVVCDAPEVKNLSKLPSFLMLRTATFVLVDW